MLCTTDSRDISLISFVLFKRGAHKVGCESPASPQIGRERVFFIIFTILFSPINLPKAKFHQGCPEI